MMSVKPVCLSCKYFRLENVDKGLCRVDKGSGQKYPAKHPGDHCDRYQNCGQQYYIRLGWIKAQDKNSE